MYAQTSTNGIRVIFTENADRRISKWFKRSMQERRGLRKLLYQLMLII